MIGVHGWHEVVPHEVKAALIIVHGIAEHGARYRHVHSALADRGIACFVYDQRGHGLFPGRRTDVDEFADFARDLESIGSRVRERFPMLPLFVWGHSMGSVVVTLAAIDGMRWARGIITTGCALDALPKLDGFGGWAIKAAAAVAPRFRVSLRIDASALTQDVEIQHRHMSDPLVPRSASLRLLFGFAAACRTCRSNLQKISQPWLAIHSETDQVCPVSGSIALIRGLGSQDKQLTIYPNLRHEIHNEDQTARTALFDLMSRWMLERRGNCFPPDMRRHTLASPAPPVE